MKIGVHMIILNNGKYVWWALKSSYPAVDYIAVVEGAITHDEYGNEYYHVPATREGLSLDNTGEEVRRFIDNDDPDCKVHYEQVGFVHSWEDLRNKAHSMLPGDTDIELIQDGDCLFKPFQIRNAGAVLAAYPQVYEVAEYCWSFIWDFRHVLKTGIERKDYWRWCFFRYNPSMFFERERTIAFRDGSSIERIKIDWLDFLEKSEQKTGSYIVYDPNLLNVFHFGNVQEKERMEIQLMRKFFAPQTMARNRLELPDRKRKTLMDWLKMYHKFYTFVPDTDTERFEEFTGVYPLMPFLKRHPYFDKPREWFRHDDEEPNKMSPFWGQYWWDKDDTCCGDDSSR